MNYHLSIKESFIFGKVALPASKSISNRLLIIRALSEKKTHLKNLSSSNDTLIMRRALKTTSKVVDIEDAGTCMRFLTAYFAFQNEEKIIQCTNRMKKRPIGILVEALNDLGADIKYLEKEGYPPLMIKGTKSINNTVKLHGSVSSQFITALLLIAPTLKDGLVLKLLGKIVSFPYIQMTLSLMKEFGIKWQFKDNTITINHQEYTFNKSNYTIEADWSSASYWYSLLALVNDGEIFLKGLKKNSIQGDIAQIKLFKKLGVKSTFEKNGVKLLKTKKKIQHLDFDFTETPDLVQTLVVCCTFLNIPFLFKGLETLRIKETDRINALIIELKKFGFLLSTPSENELSWNGEKITPLENIEIDTYNDHRMAMAFAPIVFQKEEIKIKNIEVVKKSYPAFWKHLQDVGVECNPYE